jgi:type I restriction enzyme S subunit
MSAIEGWKTQPLRELAKLNYGKDLSAVVDVAGSIPIHGTSESVRWGRGYLYDGASVILGRKGSIDRVKYVEGKFWTIDTAYCLSDFEVPKPPLSEQSKIAEVLSTVDRGIEQTEALIAKQQRIKTGLMADLLTRGIDEHCNLRSEATHTFKDSPLGRIPVEWEVKTLRGVTKQITKGESPTWQGFKYHDEGIHFITSENVRKGFLDIAKSEKFISEAFHSKLNRSALRDGDVLINLVGASIARSAIYTERLEANINQAVCSVRMNEGLEASWVCEYLQLPQNVERLLGEQVETARANLSLGDIRDFEMPIPSIIEQKAVLSRISLLNNAHESALGFTSKLRSIKTALMQDLLTGQRRVTPLLNQEVAG